MSIDELKKALANFDNEETRGTFQHKANKVFRMWEKKTGGNATELIAEEEVRINRAGLCFDAYLRITREALLPCGNRSSHSLSRQYRAFMFCLLASEGRITH